MTDPVFPLGKLPADLMAQLLSLVPLKDSQVLVGPGPGMDCAVLDLGNTLLVLKSDPITFKVDDLGWYLVQINVNDIATTGATPRWLMATLLFPEALTTERLVRQTNAQLVEACVASGIDLIGGHTEVTQGLDRPIAVGTLIGEVDRADLVTPAGASPGDRLLLTKFIPIEAVAILCQEFPSRLSRILDPEELQLGLNYHRDPGISVLRDAQVALGAGRVNAMHDPTEGGLAAALWELSDACGHSLVIDRDTVPLSALARQICDRLEIDPLAAISSGALLLSVAESEIEAIRKALSDQGISSTAIGTVKAGPPGVWELTETAVEPLVRPDRDEISRLFD